MRQITFFIFLFTVFCFQSVSGLAAQAPKKALQHQTQKSAPKSAPKVETPSQPSAESTSYKQWEIRTSPLAFLVRWLTLEAGFRINEHFAFGPTAILYSGSAMPFLVGFRGHAAGLFGTYYFHALPEAGLYATARYYHEDYTSYPSPDSSPQVIRDIKGHSGTFLLGYDLPFSNNFFALLGGGIQLQMYDRVNHQGTSVTSDNKTRLVPYLEAKFGLEF